MRDRDCKRLLIVGASARSAAMSAIRSGFEPWAADRFGDIDLRECAESIQLADYPAGLQQATATAPPGPWMYTGALENQPELIDRISQGRMLYGIGGGALRAVRDPWQVAAVLRDAGLNAPRCADSAAGLPRDGSWLCKPLASAGGSRIRPWIDGPPTFGLEAPAYFQQRIEGMPVGAVFLAAGRRAHLLGVTRQLIGLDWCGLPADAAHRFRYCGSIGPLRLNSATANRFARIGDVLAEAFDLRGLFGVDAIVAGGDLAAGRSDVWPLEVNPRYTASVEVLERALGIRSIALHVAAFGGLPCATGSASVSMGADRRAAAAAEPVAHGGLADRLDDARPCCGKAILFACSDIIVGLKFPACCARRNSNCAWPTMADIPAAGSSIRAGQPVVTVLASGANEAAVLAKLKSSAELARAELAGTGACAAG